MQPTYDFDYFKLAIESKALKNKDEDIFYKQDKSEESLKIEKLIFKNISIFGQRTERIFKDGISVQETGINHHGYSQDLKIVQNEIGVSFSF